jgi:hypothetical protein
MTASAPLGLSELADRLAIRELNDAFGHSLDHGDCEAFLAIFTEDVRYRSGARLLTGHGELREFFEKRAQAGRISRHFYSGLRITFEDEHAAGTSVWITFAGDGPAPVGATAPFAVSDVSDIYIRHDQGWKISERTITQVFLNNAIAPPVPAGGKT